MMQIPVSGVYPFYDFTCLKAGIWTIAVFGFISWTVCIGLAAGFCFDLYQGLTTVFYGFQLVLVNASYIFLTSAITSIISYGDASSQRDLQKLRSVTSKMMAATLTGIGVSISIIIHFVGEDAYCCDYSAVVMGCSFSFIWLLILVPLTQRYHSKWHASLKFGEGPIVAGPVAQEYLQAAYPVTPFGISHLRRTTAVSSPAPA